MKKHKWYAAILVFCMAFIVKPAKAFWPVLDFGELPPTIKNVTNTIQSVKEVGQQMTQIQKMLGAIKGAIANISSFAQAVKGLANTSMSAFGKFTDTLNDSIGVNVQIPGAVSDALNKAGNVHSGLVNGLTDKVNNVLDGIDDGINTGNQYLNEADINNAFGKLDKKTGLSKVLNPLNEINAQEATLSEDVEEEEEEEEVPTISRMEAKEELVDMFHAMREENEQIAQDFNDLVETYMSQLNESTSLGQKILADLRTMIENTKDIPEEIRMALLKQTDSVAEKQQNTSDWAANIIESAQSAYNREYNSKIKEGINNYEKVVIAYLNNDVSKIEVKLAGEDLRKNAASLSASPDKSVLNALDVLGKELKRDITELKQNVTKAIEMNKKAEG